ncbi:flavodoxin domain-containing protein [Paraclostridium bifermentans]|uniref:flavodoxin domain-containing protein n=1 Tax=Paraclostridium bifermentans TaxID=1490 RepID=UPI00242C7AB9|nr:flavodoxin domain-containing protein [Paraclostridium bifermentans]
MCTLIAYGSNNGITKNLAMSLSEKLDSEVDVRNTKYNSSFYLDKYENVLIGINLEDGEISTEIQRFIENNIEEFKFKKLGFFTVNKDEKQINYIDNNLPKEFTGLINFAEHFKKEDEEKIYNFVDVLNNNLALAYN